jgi:hypothetical protein
MKVKFSSFSDLIATISGNKQLVPKANNPSGSAPQTL